MYRLYVAASTFFCIAACATSTPEQAVSVAKADTSTTSSDPAPAEAGDGGLLEDVDVPEVPKAATIPSDSGVVCTRERSTGSHRLTKVCRTRAEIESRREADQDLIRDVQKTPVAIRPE